MAELPVTLDRAIETLLVRPRPAWTPAIMRIIFGLVVLAWTITMAIDADDLLGPDAIVGSEFATHGRWRWFDLESSAAVWTALVVLVLASIAIIVGWRPTEWLLLTFILLVAVQRRNPVILNSGDLLLRNFALLLAFSPTGAALSLDRWRRYGRAALRTAPMVAPWGLRLIQLQLMVVYFIAFWSKGGDLWRNGTAVSTVLRLDDITRIDSPDWLVSNVVIVAILTWGALAAELTLAMFLWVKPMRPALICLGLTFHLFIDVFILVGFFGPLMMMGLLAFSDSAWLDRQIARRWRSTDVATIPT